MKVPELVLVQFFALMNGEQNQSSMRVLCDTILQTARNQQKHQKVLLKQLLKILSSKTMWEVEESLLQLTDNT